VGRGVRLFSQCCLNQSLAGVEAKKNAVESSSPGAATKPTVKFFY